ncbi:trans-acting enoyl reductase family protein [Myxococcus sp. RHSTA-1-4]|uniref:saccharopine dehydrogenase family protein n=1 Tax=Myxococcus sp. RHSTA-1-4 TaxID=2874601 RepID=UPI001CC01D30|nr:saccharopine dehydrogenase NADP-binding domain-containing protein [Myxococcus sp. RHSTA-1-4]MBZ4420609.1 saccharopine dehydrogenase NADP-binding domain-containing protein [Myxococcus sp. RHSTA-1-4]
MSKSAAEFDIVVWGATGFTGRLVAEYLARTQEAHRAKWALAGRDLGKLEEVRRGLATQVPSCAELPLLKADAKDAASLDALVSRTKVVCTTVGPYARYGTELVAACARSGTDYCDLTGEVQWMRRMIDAHHDEARATGARIVHTCGFDSIPSDLGVLMMQEHMREKHGGHLRSVRLYMGPMRGGASGGTVASALQAVEEGEKDRSVRRILVNPHALDPDPKQPRNPAEKDLMSVRYSQELGQWTGPFVMAAVNTRVVRRSHALLGYPWGRDFIYSEVASYGAGAKGLARATSMTAGLGGFFVALQVKPLRKLLESKVLPAPGQGPSAEAREKGFFVAQLLGEGVSPRTGREVRLKGKVAAKGDPGYAATARMLSESALSLAFDSVPTSGGVLTPASCMGMRLVERLRRAGMTFEVQEQAS